MPVYLCYGIIKKIMMGNDLQKPARSILLFSSVTYASHIGKFQSNRRENVPKCWFRLMYKDTEYHIKNSWKYLDSRL